MAEKHAADVVVHKVRQPHTGKTKAVGIEVDGHMMNGVRKVEFVDHADELSVCVVEFYTADIEQKVGEIDVAERKIEVPDLTTQYPKRPIKDRPQA